MNIYKKQICNILTFQTVTDFYLFFHFPVVTEIRIWVFCICILGRSFITSSEGGGDTFCGWWCDYLGGRIIADSVLSTDMGPVFCCHRKKTFCQKLCTSKHVNKNGDATNYGLMKQIYNMPHKHELCHIFIWFKVLDLIRFRVWGTMMMPKRHFFGWQTPTIMQWTELRLKFTVWAVVIFGVLRHQREGAEPSKISNSWWGNKWKTHLL